MRLRLCDSLAAMTGNSSNTVPVAAAIESLVRSAVAGPHVVVLVPDVSVTLGPGNVGRVVVPLGMITIKLTSALL